MARRTCKDWTVCRLVSQPHVDITADQSHSLAAHDIATPGGFAAWEGTIGREDAARVRSGLMVVVRQKSGGDAWYGKSPHIIYRIESPASRAGRIE